VRFASGSLMLVAVGCASPDAPTTVDAGGSDGAALLCLVCVDASFDAPLAVRVGGILGSCAGDDSHNHGKGNLGISGANDFSHLMDARSWEMPTLYRVSPGDPAQSYVYRKVACEGGIDGDCMPQGYPNPAIAKVFHDWIAAGAPTE
jgi:hypothetical protein